MGRPQARTFLADGRLTMLAVDVYSLSGNGRPARRRTICGTGRA